MLKLIISVITTALLLMPLWVYAKEATYTIDYAPTSKVTGPSLKNNTVQIQLYVGGNSVGRLTKKTNKKQSITIDNRYGNLLVVEVLSVSGEADDISCHGASIVGKTNITIDCHPIYGKGHVY